MKTIPRPGSPVRGSQSGAPIMALFDLLGRRWAMGVLWTLCEGGPATFRTLLQRCETISPSVLNQRLKELKAAKFLCSGENGYQPTKLGQQVYHNLLPLGATARDWARLLDEGEGGAAD